MNAETERTEIGRFTNQFGERFVVFDDHTFAGDETDWIITTGEDFVFEAWEANALASILLARSPSEKFTFKVGRTTNGVPRVEVVSYGPAATESHD